MKIEIENHTIEFNVQYGNSEKLSIHIDSLGLITVKVPQDTSKGTIMSAMEHQGKWILEKKREIAETQETPRSRNYHEKGTFFYLGKEHYLHELIETNELTEEELKRDLKKFYFTSCKKIVGERILIYQKQLGVKPKIVEIEESRTKWGSCSSDRKLMFNYRLAMAPIEVIDYVVIHELCHLLHMNHDRSFWRRVGSMMPDYKDKQAYLADHGHSMSL
jgi:predicted metal-dependent hydrolase